MKTKIKLIFALILISLLNGCVLFVLDEVDELPRIQFNFDNNPNVSSIDYDKMKTIINIELIPCTENYLEGDVNAPNGIKTIRFYKSDGEDVFKIVENFTIERGFDSDTTHHFKIPAIAHDFDVVGYYVDVEDNNQTFSGSKTVFFHYAN